MSVTQYGSLPIHAPDKIYLIGDIHNEADKLMDILDQIEPLLAENDHIVFCGDLVDRGSQPALTIETLVDLAKRRPNQVFFIEGNHDLMLRDYLTRGSHMWMQYLLVTLEGLKTSWDLPDILPYTIAQALISKEYTLVTRHMLPYYETDKVIVTHAPLDKTVVVMNGGNHYQQDYSDRANNPAFTHLLDRMKYELKWQFTDESLIIPEVDKFKVCGHQAGRGHHPRIFKDRAFIDTGCGLRPNGVLTCLVFPSKKTYQAK